MYPYNKSKFFPKKPVRSFCDLEVYQKTMECSVILVKNIRPTLFKLKYPFLENMVNCAMSIPLYIGEAHSIRFGDHKAGILFLERAMAGCNKMIIYLEQIKGIYGRKLDQDLIDDLIRRYSEVRTKIFHLEKSWQKWTEPRR